MAITSKRGRELLGAAADPVSRAVQLEERDWTVNGSGPEVSVWVGRRCVASFDVDTDLPEDERREIGAHLRAALNVGLGL